MSKFLVTAAAIVGGVALAATGFGLAVDATVAASLGTATIAGVAVSTIATVASVASAGLSFLAELTAKKPSSVGSPTEWKADPDAGMDIVLGDAFNGGHIIYRQAYGSKNKYETIVTHWSVGPVHSIDTTYVDGQGRDVSGNEILVQDRGTVYQATQLGLCPEPAALSCPPVAPYGWTAQHQLSGKAAIMNTLVYDAKGSVTFTSTPAMGWRGKGMLCYDPRKDSTYAGGSGAHRQSDQTTWEWSANPFICGLTYCLGWRQNGKLAAGVGVTSGIIVEQFVEGANVCDVNGWTCGGVKSTTDDKWDTLKDILQAGGGEPIRLGAQLGCIVKTPRVSLATIDRDCLAPGKITVPTATARRDRINTVSPRYWFEQVVFTQDDDGDLISTTTWAQISGAPIGVPEYVAADGRERRKSVDYPLVQCFDGHQPTQVAQLARYDIEDAREFSGISLPLKLRWMGYKPGDVVTVNLPEVGLTDQDVLLLNRGLEPSSGVVTMTARTETSAKHAYALGQTTIAPASPSVAAPDLSAPAPKAGSWTLTGGTVSSPSGTSTPAIIIAGAVDSDSADAVIFEYRLHVDGQADDAGWSSALLNSASATGITIGTVADGMSYDAAVSYRSRGRIGKRLIIGPATAGALAIAGVATSDALAETATQLASAQKTITAQQTSIAALTARLNNANIP